MDPTPVPFAPNQKIAQPKGQYYLIFQQLRIFPEGSTVRITLPPESSFKHHNIHLIKYQQDVLEQSYERGKVILFQVDPAAQQVRYQLFISKFRIDIIAKFIPLQFQYPMNQRIGKGAFGECYVVQENEKNPERCLKIIRFQKPQERCFEIMSIVRQVGICKLLGFLEIGPFIYTVRGFDFLVFDNYMCYEMGLCEPLYLIIEDLKQQAGNQSSREELLQNVQKDLVENTYLLHSLKLVHKDIKPANILYSKERRRYIFCDFGLTHSVQQNWDQRTRVTEPGGTPGFMCEEMQILFEKKQKKQKISSQQEMVNLYQNDQFALRRTLESIRGSFKSGKSATLPAVPSVVRDVWSRYSEYFSRQSKEAPQAQRMQFLKGACGCTLPLLMHWREHISSLEGQKRQQQWRKYLEYIAYFKIPYFQEQLDKLEILLLQRGITDKVHQQSYTFLIYSVLIGRKCKDLKLLLRCLQYITSNNISNILISPYFPITFEEVEQGLLNATLKALNYLQEHLNSPGDAMQKQFFTLCHTLVLREQPLEGSLQQRCRNYASSAKEFVSLVRQFQSPKHLEELLSFSQITVHFFLQRNSVDKELEAQPLISMYLTLDMQGQLHAPFQQFMQLKRRSQKYYELSTLKLYCKALLLYSQNKLSAGEVIPQLLQEAEKVYDGLCKRDSSYSYTPEAGILNMFRGTVYKLIPQKREQALESSYEALKSIREHYGEQNSYMPQIKKNIAQILQEMEQYDLAKQFYMEAVHLVLTDQGVQLRIAVMKRKLVHDMNMKTGLFESEPLQLVSENQYTQFLDLVRTSPEEAQRYVQVQLQLYYKTRRSKGAKNQEQRLAVEFIRFLSREKSFFRYNNSMNRSTCFVDG